jgi:hypothetical protein
VRVDGRSFDFVSFEGLPFDRRQFHSARDGSSACARILPRPHALGSQPKEVRMAAIRSFSKVKPRAQQTLAGAVSARGPKRVSTRLMRASDDGVWTSALFMSLVSLLMPFWYLGTGSALSTDAALSSATRVPHIVQLGLGSVAVWFAVRSAFILARAPRLGRGHHRITMRRLSVAVGLLAALFLHRFVYNSDGLASDPLAYIGAMAPAVLMAEISFALPAIAKGRHGTEVGTRGGVAWIAVALTTPLAGLVPSSWWTALALSVFASACTGLAALRVWRRYEGRIVGA